jgi:prepilin-type processing-associated H-X9-DG protein
MIYLTQHYTDHSYAPVRICPALADNADVGILLGAGNGGTGYFLFSNTSYLYNPHWAYSSLTGTWPNGGAAELGSMVSWYTKVSNFDPYKCLACDMIYQPGLVAHVNRASDTFNLAFIDGHVTAVTDKILSNPHSGALWPKAQEAVSAVAGLTTLDDDLDILETEADGRNPSTANADPALAAYESVSTPYIDREQSPTGKAGSNTDHPPVPWL